MAFRCQRVNKSECYIWVLQTHFVIRICRKTLIPLYLEKKRDYLLANIHYSRTFSRLTLLCTDNWFASHFRVFALPQALILGWGWWATAHVKVKHWIEQVSEVKQSDELLGVLVPSMSCLWVSYQKSSFILPGMVF